MSDIKNLITVILSDEKLRKSKSFRGGVYRDEPIIKTAAQLKKPEDSKLREMRNLMFSMNYHQRSSEYLFYIQGKFMEDYEDNAPYYGEVVKYFPTYQDMTNEQLRGYFTWRKKVRNGIVEKTSLSFAFMYIYELINQIGVSSAEEGFLKLKDFAASYGAVDRRIISYVKSWLTDYAVYYGLEPSLLADSEDAVFDDSLIILLNYKSHGEDELFSALQSLSSYRIESSKFYKEYPEEVRAEICAVYRTLSEYYEKHRKAGFCESLFGKRLECVYDIFHSAVFYDRLTENRKYVLNEIHRYSCSNGMWRCEKYYGNRGRNAKLGAVIKTIDCLMREKYGYRFKLRPEPVTKTTLNIIEKEIEKYLEQKRKNSVPKIEIDISKLRGIRAAADITRDKLIVDESFGEECYEASPAETVDRDLLADEPELCTNEPPLDDMEYRFMQCLLYGGDYSSLIKERGVMLSVLADSVNEKLFDEFGDTVIEFTGDVPVPVDDYTDDLKGIIKP